MHAYDACGKPARGAAFDAQNRIPVSSGMGSSAAAILTGLFAANEMIGDAFDEIALLKLATELEGHPDNVAAALLGGLVVSVTRRDERITQRFDVPEISIVVVKPDFDWHTRAARAMLPHSISRADAVHNIGRAVLVVDALRRGDLELLQKVMDDRLHQPYRIKHITGGPAAYKAAKKFGAAALSGAGPSIVAFVAKGNEEAARVAMCTAFAERGIQSRALLTRPSNRGLHKLL